MFYAVSIARVIFIVKTSLSVFSQSDADPVQIGACFCLNVEKNHCSKTTLKTGQYDMQEFPV